MLSWFYAFERFIFITNKKVVKVLDLKTISSDFLMERSLVMSWFYVSACAPICVHFLYIVSYVIIIILIILYYIMFSVIVI